MAPGKCLYDLLDITKDADDDVIKKAYRKQALIWHPDKNSHRLEEAAERFKEVQNAYEVLSDPHERSWYDSHRDQIIKSGERHQAGGTGFDGGSKPDDEEDMFPYFSSNCFSGYGDGPKGFYGVYAALFERLTRQEMEAFEEKDDDEEASGSKDCPSFPRFGSASSDAVEVNAFYTFWSHFSTFKKFSWADLYNPAAAPSRPVRRRMEEENRKARRAKRREYNDTLRELVAFIRKRDKRVAKIQAEEATRRAARQAEDDERRRAEREARLAAAAEYEEADWIKASDAARRRDDEVHDRQENSTGEEQDQQGFFCVVCDKSFRSEKQLHNHERSKKHQEQLAQLRAVLAADADLDADAVHEALGARAGHSGQQPDVEDRGRRRGKKKNKKKGKQTNLPEDDSEGEGEAAVDDDHPHQPAAPAGGTDEGQQVGGDEHKQARECEDEDAASASMQSKAGVEDEPAVDGKFVDRHGDDALPEEEEEAEEAEAAEVGDDDDDGEEEDDDDDDEHAMLARLLVGRKPAPSVRKPAASTSSAKPTTAAAGGGEEDSGGASCSGVTKENLKKGAGAKAQKSKGATSVEAVNLKPAAARDVGGPQVQPAPVATSVTSDDEAEREVKLSKKAKRKAKASAASKPAADDKSCKTCGERFQSRSQLFKHLETTGHASTRA